MRIRIRIILGGRIRIRINERRRIWDMIKLKSRELWRLNGAMVAHRVPSHEGSQWSHGDSNGAEKAHKGSFEDLGLEVGDSCHFDEDEDRDPH